MAEGDRILTQDGVDALWAHSKNMVDHKIENLMQIAEDNELPVYEQMVFPAGRGTAFKVLSGGKYTPYRLTADMASIITPFSVATVPCERLNLRTLSRPLSVRKSKIDELCS